MTASYLLRFDDLCATMNWAAWEPVERALVDARVRPILAVIPDNRDPVLEIDPPNDGFWDRVRVWQSWGWTIGLHGYQHLYTSSERGLFGWNGRSEFAGLPYEEQREKIGRGLEVFRQQGVEPEVWVAPNHAFDRTTIAALRDSGVRSISDGLALYPFRDGDDMLWLPLQAWRFEPRSVGVWTVCLHHNSWTAEDVEAFRGSLRTYADRITDVASVSRRYGDRRLGAADRLFIAQRKLKRSIRGAQRRLVRRPASRP